MLHDEIALIVERQLGDEILTAVIVDDLNGGTSWVLDRYLGDQPYTAVAFRAQISGNLTKQLLAWYGHFLVIGIDNQENLILCVVKSPLERLLVLGLTAEWDDKKQ